MQAVLLPRRYSSRVAGISNLQKLRKKSGLTMRELARQVGVDHSNIRYWEQTGKIPRSNLLAPIAKALGVTVEELLGQSPTRKAVAPGGRLGQICDEIGKLPRSQQSKLFDTIETLLAGQVARKEAKPS